MLPPEEPVCKDSWSIDSPRLSDLIDEFGSFAMLWIRVPYLRFLFFELLVSTTGRSSAETICSVTFCVTPKRTTTSNAIFDSVEAVHDERRG